MLRQAEERKPGDIERVEITNNEGKGEGARRSRDERAELRPGPSFVGHDDWLVQTLQFAPARYPRSSVMRTVGWAKPAPGQTARRSTVPMARLPFRAQDRHHQFVAVGAAKEGAAARDPFGGKAGRFVGAARAG